MSSNRKVIRALAGSAEVARATADVAEKIASRARQYDPTGQFLVRDQLFVDINGLRRVASVVENVAENAARREFDDNHGAPLRPLGRASAEHKG